MKITKVRVGIQKVNCRLEPRFLEPSLCTDKLLKKIGGKISRKLTPEEKDSKFVREETTASLELAKSITISTEVLVEKYNPKMPNYILLGNNWFYGQKYDDELQIYIPEIVTNTEDTWQTWSDQNQKEVIPVNKRNIYDFYKSLPGKSKHSLSRRSNISATSDSEKYNPKMPNYILLGNNWFYGQKYDDELQIYIPEIVTNTEDTWQTWSDQNQKEVIPVNKRNIYDFYKSLPGKSKHSLSRRSNISATSDSGTSDLDTSSNSDTSDSSTLSSSRIEVIHTVRKHPIRKRKVKDNLFHYMNLLNPNKYEHTYNPGNNFVIVENKGSIVGVFDYTELYVYLEMYHPSLLA
ncbi:hypothetical protein Glove_216g166 [Diversispora epigaea]|uniref:Uncharacterized protein n=1 Tax=Diversispora epigaea TaxID=1348612 RepID=A0A397IQM8_9GLOM|nr:hypothetical protein Glove_216g166 [Diversispora epigaea]